MKTIKLAAMTIAMSGAFALNQNAAFAKGPLEVTVDSPLILVKETPTEIDLSDFPFGLREGVSKNVRMSFDQEIPNPEDEDSPVRFAYTITLPTLEVEKDGDDSVTITFPEQYTLTTMLNLEDEPVVINAEGIAENQVMTFERDGERMTYIGTADAFGFTMTSPQAAENGVDFLFTMSGKGLDINGAGAAEQDWTDIQTLDLSYDYTMEGLAYKVNAAKEGDDEAFEMTGSVGSLEASGQIGQGRIEGATSANDMVVNVARPLPIDVTVGKLATSMGMPTDPSPDPQEMSYLIGAEDIKLDDFLWDLMDPAGAFKRELNKVVIDLEMQAMLTASILDPIAMAEAEANGVPPLLPLGAKIKSIAFDGLGLELNAKGEGAMKGIQPEAEAFITLKGLSEFVASAQKVGMFGEQEAMMIEGMAGQLGKEGNDGELIFDVKTDGGMLNVNGAPIMPIPSIPQ